MLNDEYSPTSLIARGYRKGAPRHGTNRRLGDIDQHVTESMTCKTCGGQMRYEGWYKPRSYLALAVCGKCGAVVEF